MISRDITNSSRDVLSQDEALTKKNNPDSCHLDDPKPLPKRYTQESASRTGLPSRTHTRWMSQPERWRLAVSWKGLVKRTGVQACPITFLQKIVSSHKNTSDESNIKAGHTNFRNNPMHCIEEGTPFAEISLKTSKLIKLVAYITNRQLACGLGPCLSISVSCFTISSHADLSLKGKNLGNPVSVTILKCVWDSSILVKT